VNAFFEHRRKVATAVLDSLRVGSVPWRYPDYMEPEFEPIFFRFGCGGLSFEWSYNDADELIRATGARIIHHWRCRRPHCVRPPRDRIVLPPRTRFVNDSQYYATVFHEIIHFVEQPERAGWIGSDHQGELVAECGTGFLEAHLDLPHDHDNTNIEKWLPAWCERIKANPEYLFDAVAQAERSVRYIVDLHRRWIARQAVA
jgi:antirestriction protein ArdC